MLKADNLSPSCAVVMKSGNILETFGTVQACNKTALSSTLLYIIVTYEIYNLH